jgi:anti-sigma factor ChrR (cupin superfamily)
MNCESACTKAFILSLYEFDTCSERLKQSVDEILVLYETKRFTAGSHEPTNRLDSNPDASISPQHQTPCLRDPF